MPDDTWLGTGQEALVDDSWQGIGQEALAGDDWAGVGSAAASFDSDWKVKAMNAIEKQAWSDKWSAAQRNEAYAALDTPEGAAAAQQSLQSGLGGGGAGGGSPQDQYQAMLGGTAGSRREMIGGDQQQAGGLTAGSLLGLAAGRQQPSALQFGQQALQTPGGVQAPGQQQQPSFGGLLSTQQPQQQQQMQQQPAQEAARQTFAGPGTQGPANQLFSRGAGAGPGAGSSGAAFASQQPTPWEAAGREGVQQAAQQQPGLTDVGRGALLGGLAGGAIGGAPAVGGMPGMTAAGQPIQPSMGAGGAPMGGTAPGQPGAVDPVTGAPKAPEAAKEPSFKQLVDPDSDITLDTAPKAAPQQQSIKDPDSELSVLSSVAKSIPFMGGAARQAEKIAKTPFGEAAGQGIQRGLVDIGGTVAQPFRKDARKERTGVERQLRREEEELRRKHPDAPYQVAAGLTAGELAPYATLPAGGATKAASMVGRFASRVAKGAGVGAAMGAAQYAPTGKGQIKNALLGSALGAGARALMPMLGGLGKGIGKLFGAGKLAKQAKLEAKFDISPKATVKARASAKRLGVTLSPAQATQAPRLAAKERVMTPSEAGTLEATKHIVTTEKKLISKMRDTIKSVLPKGATPERTSKVAGKMYESVAKRPVSNEMKKTIAKDETLQQFMKEAMSPKVSKAASYPEGSAGRLIETEKYIKNIMKKGEDPGLGGETVKKIQGMLDKEFTRYGGARKLAQKAIVHRNMVKDMESIGLKAGAEEAVADQLHTKFFGSIAKQKEFLKGIGQTGGNRQQAADLIRTLNSVKNSEFRKIMAKDPSLWTKHEAQGGPMAATTTILRKLFMRGHDAATVRMMINPNYADDLARLSKNPTGFAEFFQQVAALEGVREGAPYAGEMLGVEWDSRLQSAIKVQFDKLVMPKDDDQEDTPVVNQVPAVATQAIINNAKSEEARKMADKIMLMSPKELDKYASTLKGREKLLDIVKKTGGQAAYDKLMAMFRKRDGLTGVDARTPLEAITAKFNADKKEAKKKLAVAKTPSAKDKYNAMVKRLDAEYNQKKLAHRKRAAVGRRVSGRSGRQRSAFSSQILSIVLSYLTKNSKVQQMLASVGMKGDIARAVLPELERRAGGATGYQGLRFDRR